jgi:hypothetical protein
VLDQCLLWAKACPVQLASNTVIVGLTTIDGASEGLLIDTVEKGSRFDGEELLNDHRSCPHDANWSILIGCRLVSPWWGQARALLGRMLGIAVDALFIPLYLYVLRTSIWYIYGVQERWLMSQMSPARVNCDWPSIILLCSI